MAQFAGIVLPMIIGLSAISGALAIPAIVDASTRVVRRAQARARIVSNQREARIGPQAIWRALFADLCRNGVPVLRPLTRSLMRLAVVRSRCELVAQALPAQQQACTSTTACELLLTVLIVGFLFWLLLLGNPLIALSLTLAVIGVLLGQARKSLRHLEQKLHEQIPDALRSLGICFSAGFSLQQALEQTACDTDDPLGKELTQVTYDILAGRSLEEALRRLEQRTNVADLRFVIIALEIQHQTGGSLQEILENAAASILSSLDLRRSLAVQTAQARMSARVVTLMPVVLVVLLSLMMEGYLQSFLSSSVGLLLLGIALTMELAGILAIRKILGINLN